MNVDIVKTSQTEGAVYFKYRTHKASPEYNVTLPFKTNEDSLLSFNMTEETLRDLVRLLQSKG